MSTEGQRKIIGALAGGSVGGGIIAAAVTTATGPVGAAVVGGALLGSAMAKDAETKSQAAVFGAAGGIIVGCAVGGCIQGATTVHTLLTKVASPSIAIVGGAVGGALGVQAGTHVAAVVVTSEAFINIARAVGAPQPVDPSPQSPQPPPHHGIPLHPTNIDERPDEAFDLDVPEAFLGPIMQSILRDPVMAMDGITYERRHIEEWWRTSTGPPTSPMHRTVLVSTDLIPLKIVRDAIAGGKASASRPQRAGTRFHGG